MPQLHGPLPTILQNEKPISIQVAKNWLAAYSIQAEQNPHMHPSSTFTPERLEFSSHGPSGGITMHLLSRIKKGLSGEVLEPMKEDPEGDDKVLDSQIEGKRKKEKGKDGKEGGKKRKQPDATTDSEWEDPSQYALEQGEADDVGEIGDRHNFVQAVDHEPDVLEHDKAGHESKSEEQIKRERKEAKKARHKAEKKEKAEKGKKEKAEKGKKQKFGHGEDEEYI